MFCYIVKSFVVFFFEIIFFPQEQQNFLFSPFFLPYFTSYIHVFLNKSSYFSPNLPKTHIFVPQTPGGGGKSKIYTPANTIPRASLAGVATVVPLFTTTVLHPQNTKKNLHQPAGLQKKHFFKCYLLIKSTLKILKRTLKKKNNNN